MVGSRHQAQSKFEPPQHHRPTALTGEHRPTTHRGIHMGNKASITFKGNTMSLNGQPPQVGADAPNAKLIAIDLSEVELSSYKGKTVIVSCVPSLDTGVCSIQTKKFNEEAASLGDNTVVVTVSLDLPFAQKRWCGAEGVERVVTLSDYRHHDFVNKWGLLIEPLGLIARAVFVVDADGKVQHAELVAEATNEPDYASALAKAKSIA